MKNICFLLVFLSFHQLSNACSCIAPPSLCEYSKTLETSDLGIIFIGEYVQEEEIEFAVAYQFRITKLIRGTVIDENSSLYNGSEFKNTDELVWVKGGQGATCLRYMEGKVLFATSYDDFFGYVPDACTNSYFQISDSDEISGTIWKWNEVDTVSVNDIENVITGTCLTNTKELEKQFATSLQVHPNPTSDVLTLNIDNQFFKELSFEVFDANGQLMDEGFFEGSYYNLDMGQYAQGVYILRFTKDRFRYSKRVVRL